MSIQTRATSALNLERYAYYNDYDRIHAIKAKCPLAHQYILRMPIQRPFGEILIPKELDWTKSLIRMAYHNQKSMNIFQPFCYITIRHGIVESITDDEWHVDGFSTRITHLPEQNYIWCNNKPTEVVCQAIKFPKDFNPQKHNIHFFIQDKLKQCNINIETLDKNVLYCLDPYIIHRRPKVNMYEERTFIRISFTPIEIIDNNNTINPLLPISKCDRDSVKDFRNKLKRYKFK